MGSPDYPMISETYKSPDKGFSAHTRLILYLEIQFQPQTQETLVMFTGYKLNKKPW